MLSTLDLPVPPQLTATKQIDGFRNPQWVMVRLSDAELGPVADTVRQTYDRLVPAKPRRILEIMFSLVKRHKQDQKGRSDAEWEAIAHEYVEDLGQYSEAHINAAIREYRRSSKWFPHQSELIALCEPMVWMDKTILRRGQVLLGQAEPYHWERIPPPESTEPVVLKPAAEILAEHGFGVDCTRMKAAE